MKYLVNRKTKEHKAATREDLMLIKDFGTNSDVFDLVEADSEGWIPHTGTECPLPDDCIVEIRFSDGNESKCRLFVKDWVWHDQSITHYKPILEPEKVQESEPVVKESFTTGLLNRLKAAHQTAQQIPDLEAKLREVLGSMGYDLVARSPFVEPEAAVETPQDMSDWRNWREGDWVRCIDSFGWGGRFLVGSVYKVEKIKPTGLIIAGKEINRYVGDFRFHSRPAKGE